MELPSDTGLKMTLNRQEVLGNVNPLFKKFVQEGENPSSYIPAAKRRQIYDFMGRTNYTSTNSKPPTK